MRKYEFNYNICHVIAHARAEIRCSTSHKNQIEMKLFSDEYFMNEAFKEARHALQKDEVPIGAVIVWNNRIIARAHNLVETLNDPTAHAEMQAFTSATNTIGGKYLDACTLYVTVEPCVMCAGAAFWTQLGQNCLWHR